MRLRLILFLIYLKFHFVACAIGQPVNSLQFLPNDINDRLPHSDINSIMQDKYGFLWFSTYGGLCKYDGKNLNTFSSEIGNQNSLSSSRVLCTKELNDGSILIGTEGGGLNHYFPKMQSFKIYKKGKSINSISGDVISSIYQTSDESIWIGTNSGLDLMHFDDSAVYFERVFSSPDGIRAITETSDWQLIFGTGLRVFEMKKDGQYKLKYEFNSGITSILPLCNKRLLVGCEKGLHSLSDSGMNTISTFSVITSYQAHDSTIWVGTRGFGLLKFDQNLKLQQRFTAHKSDPRSLTFDEVSSLYEDHSGVLWIGTYGRGLNKLDLRAKKFELFTKSPWKTNSLSGDRVISFFEDSKSRIWIGIRGNGINILGTDSEITSISEKPESPFNGQSVSSFFEDPNGGIWIGTWGGGIVVLPKEKIPILLEGGFPEFDTLLAEYYSVEKILEDYEGHIWLSTTNGLIQYIPGKEDYYKGEFKVYNSEEIYAPLTSSFIRDIFVEKGNVEGEKIIWVGTINGLNRLAIKEYQHNVIHITSSSSDSLSLPSNFISVIMEDSKDSLWFSCLGGGIAKMITGRDGKTEVTFQIFNKSNGFPNNEIETMLEDDRGQFWMGGYGLTRFNPITNDIVGFDINDGLQSNAFKVWAALKTRDGKLVFGGTKGFNMFCPDEIEVNNVPPRLTFTDIKVNNKAVSVLNQTEGYSILDSSILVTREIELPYELNSFTISFAALHYTSPENNQLKFKLEGVDSDWLKVNGSEHSRNYSQLKPGNYSFIFTGANSDNIWVEQPLSLKIVIKKPYWATNYAIALYIVIVLCVLFIFRKYSIIQVKEMGKIKLDRLQRGQAEELNRLKINFYTEVSHELRTPLSLIKGPVFDILETQQLDLNDQNKLEIVGRNVERMSNIVDEIMLFTEYGREMVRLKAAEGDIIGFVKEIQLFFSAEAMGRNIDFRYDSEVTSFNIFFDRDKLEKVFFNLLSNAFKFTPNGGKIEITERVNSDNKNITFMVFNTGKPIPDYDIDHIFERFYTSKDSKVKGHGIGLSIAYQIIEQHRGKIWVENQANGICFYVELSASKDHFKSSDLIKDFTNSNNPSHYVQMDIESNKPVIKIKGKSILIVEDNFELRNYLTKYFSEHFKILIAENGLIGYELAMKSRPDLIISDLMMPEMDGLTMCRKLKSDVQTSHIPIIILTARTTLMQQIDGYEVGADAYVTKPFNARLLLARTVNLINSREKLRKLLKEYTSLSPKEITVTSLDEKILTKTIEIIEKHMDNSDFGVDKLCEEIGMSRSQLYRKIKALTSYSINGFIRLIRLKRAAQLLEQDNSYISDVMHQVGFENLSYFSRAFKEQFGISPKQYTVKHDEGENS